MHLCMFYKGLNATLFVINILYCYENTLSCIKTHTENILSYSCLFAFILNLISNLIGWPFHHRVTVEKIRHRMKTKSSLFRAVNDRAWCQ